jgi:hypothetical protein
MSTLRLPSINAGACLGLTLSGDFFPVLKGETWRRRTGQFYCLREKEGRGEMVGLFFFNEFFFF